MAGYRVAYTQLLDMVERLLPQRLLFELAEQPDIPVFDQLWLNDYLIPRLLQSPVRRIVIAIPHRRVYNQQALEASFATASGKDAQLSCDVQFFVTPTAGLYWLTDYSSRLAALLAEWAEANPGTDYSDEVGEPSVPYGPIA